MKNRFTAPFFLTLAFAVLAASLRLWSLLTAIDSQGLPIMALPVYLLVAAAALFLLLALALAHTSPGRSSRFQALQYDTGGFVCGMIAAALILLGVLADFGEALVSGPGFSDPIMCLLGLLGSICCFLAVRSRSRGSRCHPAVELLPILYLLIKLILNFKHWSTDPIILDYCFVLFALIFVLLAFYHGAGFVFHQGKPRRTLFYAMAAVFFCAAAIFDGLMDFSLATAVSYGGFLLWQLPVIWSLLLPSDPEPVSNHEAEGRRKKGRP